MTWQDMHMLCIKALGQAWSLLKPSKLHFLDFNRLQASGPPLGIDTQHMHAWAVIIP